MPAPSIASLRKKLDEVAWQGQFTYRERALLGKLDDDGNKVVASPTRPGWIYVRIERAEGGVSETQAINTQVANQYGLKVWVGPNQDRQLTVIGLREGEAVEEHGSDAAYLRLPDTITRGTVSERRFLPGLASAKTIDGSYTMSVYVSAFTYQYAGWLQAWVGGWIDLTANVPATANKRRWVLIGLDPATNALAAVDGSDYGLPVSLSTSQLIDIDPGAMIPLAGVNLFNGMTAVDRETYFIDARPWYAAPGIEHSAGFQTTDDTETVMVAIGVPELTALVVHLTILGFSDDCSAGLHATGWAGFRRESGGDVVIINDKSSTTREDSAGSPIWDLVANTTTQTADITVTGVAAETWNWRVIYHFVSAP